METNDSLTSTTLQQDQVEVVQPTFTVAIHIGEDGPPAEGSEADQALQDIFSAYNWSGNISFPDNYQPTDPYGKPNCGIVFNASRPVCDALISSSKNSTTITSRNSTVSCDCYSFCGGELSDCYSYGESPEFKQCGTNDIILGCEDNFEPRPSENSVDGVNNKACPPGYMCSRDRMQSCAVIRLIPIVALLGDVHAGMYCPGSEDRTQNNGYENCPAGFYCPNSTSKVLCPRGYYCPHKTLYPSIKCATCEEGATTLERENYGWVVLLFAFGILLALFVWDVFKRRNQRLFNRIAAIQERSWSTMRSAVLHKQRQTKLRSLRPKLQVIEKRLNNIRGIGSDSTGALSTGSTSDGMIQFSADELFDALDTDKNGELSYTELNQVLMLESGALLEFSFQMNQAASLPKHTNTISRAVFTRYFLTALDASIFFEPTEEDAAKLFDDIARSRGIAINENDTALPYEAFFDSQLADFLTDAEINHLLKRIQRSDSAKASVTDEENPRSGRVHRVSQIRASHARVVVRENFIARYPQLLFEVTTARSHSGRDHMMAARKIGVDLTFENLCLTVRVKSKSAMVVNHVTGRLQAGTMTALMGGSGAGKTSLLNALCGRAFYGDVSGVIRINGHIGAIEDHSDAVGFVPQDDIVYSELTVRENFIYSGKFQLPCSTPIEDIEELADDTMASLGLSRVMHSMVGDVNRRGVSGGEKKRVNIGLELMSRPKLLFLDEPTSGLDASSAMLVMQSLKNLVQTQGVTICSVIHQPRKFIFELFDSLILLSFGGHVVYNGHVGACEYYFRDLGYVLPPGESIADWLIDISSGRLEPQRQTDDETKQSFCTEQFQANKLPELQHVGGDETEATMDMTEGRDIISQSWARPSSNEAATSEATSVNSTDLPMAGPEKERIRREQLVKHWMNHFNHLSSKDRAAYDAPDPFDLPTSKKRASFHSQLMYQMQRLLIIGRRNIATKLLDSAIIVGAVILVSLFDGVVTPTKHQSMESLNYYSIAEPEGTLDNAARALILEFPKLFKYALRGNASIIEYALKLGVIIAVLVGLNATKALTEKRNEFFREAGSGYDINAYFMAVNIISTLEHSIQVIFSSMMALWLRNSLASWYSFYINFLLLAWLCVSWAMLFPLFVPLKNVVLVTGFYMTFAAILFSGAISPVEYSDTYEKSGIAVLSGLFSPTRFFLEAMAVSESRCLPVQSGFTNIGPALRHVEQALQVMSFPIVGQGLNDFGTVTDQNCRGWYWGALPAVVVGLAIRFLAFALNHVCGRSKQAKPPLMKTIAARPLYTLSIICSFLIILAGLLEVAIWLLLRTSSSVKTNPWAEEVEDYLGFQTNEIQKTKIFEQFDQFDGL